MAKRYNLRQTDACRDKIKTSQLINRLERHVLAELELSATQLKAIEILLRKTLPDLASVEHTGDALRPFAVIPEQMQDVSAWTDRFAPKPETEH